MADENQQFEPEIKSSKKGGLNPKVFIIGIPLFILQLVVIYFILGYMMDQKYSEIYGNKGTPKKGKVVHEKVEEEYEEDVADTSSIGKYLVNVEDIIINPADAGTQALVLISLGVDVLTESMQKELNEKQVLVRDVIISTLAKKNVDTLSDINYRDSLRIELSQNLVGKFHKLKINQIYFSKYIIQ